MLIVLSSRLVALFALVCAAAGMAAATVAGSWDLLVLFALIGLLQVLLLASHRANRRSVTLRPDLAHAIERQSQRTSEPFDDVLDRAVAFYHHGLYRDADLEDP